MLRHICGSCSLAFPHPRPRAAKATRVKQDALALEIAGEIASRPLVQVRIG
jgi:hypothetical protein